MAEKINMDVRQLFDLVKEVTILEMNQKKTRSRIKEIRSLLGDFRPGPRVEGDTITGKALSYLQQAGKPAEVKEIAEAVRGKRASVNAALWRAAKEGLLSRDGRGYYSLGRAS